MVLWFHTVARKNISLSDKLIQEKVKSLQILAGTNVRKYSSQFSYGWLHSFKKRNKCKCHRTHGEEGDADWAAAERELPVLRSLVQQYGEDFVFNADECGIIYRRPPTSTVGPAPFRERKLDKERITFLVCTNANGKVRSPPFVIGRSLSPISFGGKWLGAWHRLCSGSKILDE